jgi:hypothetical protein
MSVNKLLRGTPEEREPIKSVDFGKIIVKFVPPIPGRVYHLVHDLEFIILAPRYEGQSLWPKVSEWPFTANLWVSTDKGSLEEGPWRLLDIVEFTQL